MRIHEILVKNKPGTLGVLELGEARDWEKIRNPADRWLARFTYENIDKHPDTRIVSTLQRRYPAAPGTIYRGLNFYTANEYQDFISAFHGQQEAILPFNGVSSWTRHESSSEQFAITQPTYFLNRQVMMAHDRMSREREWLSGYRGVILSMELPPNTGIDVDASGLGHESEIVVPAGSYTVRIHRTLKRYADQLADQDTTVDQVILGLRREDLRRSSHHSFLDHVLHHHADRISDRARQHLFSLFWPKAGAELFDYTAHKSVMSGTEDAEVVLFSYGMAATELFDLYDRGIFHDPRQKQRIQQLASKILKQAMPVIETYLVRSYRCDLTPLMQVARIAGRDRELINMLRKTIGREYQRLQDQGRKINRITNGVERSNAMRAHTNALERLLSKMPRG